MIDPYKNSNINNTVYAGYHLEVNGLNCFQLEGALKLLFFI